MCLFFGSLGFQYKRVRDVFRSLILIIVNQSCLVRDEQGYCSVFKEQRVEKSDVLSICFEYVCLGNCKHVSLCEGVCLFIYTLTNGCVRSVQRVRLVCYIRLWFKSVYTCLDGVQDIPVYMCFISYVYILDCLLDVWYSL